MQRPTTRITKTSPAQIEKRNQNNSRNHDIENPSIASGHVEDKRTEDDATADDEHWPHSTLELRVATELEEQETANRQCSPENQEDRKQSALVGLPFGLCYLRNHASGVRRATYSVWLSMKAKAVSALRCKRGWRRVCGAEPQAEGAT